MAWALLTSTQMHAAPEGWTIYHLGKREEVTDMGDERKTTNSMSLSIFTMMVDHKPIIAFGCKKHSEAEAICADERVRAKLGS